MNRNFTNTSLVLGMKEKPALTILLDCKMTFTFESSSEDMPFIFFPNITLQIHNNSDLTDKILLLLIAFTNSLL